MPTREELERMAKQFVAKNTGTTVLDFYRKRDQVLAKKSDVRLFQGTTGEVVAVSKKSELTGSHFFIADGTDDFH